MVTEKNKIIYVVTSGVYSDYRIEGIFSNREDAQLLSDTITSNNYDDAEIEEWLLDNYNSQGIKELCFWDFSYYPEEDRWEGVFHTPRSHWRSEPINKVTRDKLRHGSVYYVTVRGDNRDAALKIANEKIMMAIAKRSINNK